MSDEQYEEFCQMVAAIERMTAHLSSLGKAKQFPAFQNILAMGDTARTFIFREMRRGDWRWLWFELLAELVPGVNPVSEWQRGKIDEMSAAWLKLAEIKKW